MGACGGVSENHCCIICGGDDKAGEEVLNADDLTMLQAHAGFVACYMDDIASVHTDQLLPFDCSFLQGIQDDVCGHHLCKRRGLQLLISILLKQNAV